MDPSLDKIFPFSWERSGREFRFLPSGFFCWLFPTRNVSKQDVQEGTLQQFLAHQGFFFCFHLPIFFWWSLSLPAPTAPLLCSTALFSSLQLCRSAALLLQLCLSCLGCLKQLVGNDAGYHGGYKENRCAALPHQKGPPDLSRPILLASASFCQVNPAQLVVCVCLYMLFLFTAISLDMEAKVNHGISLMFLQVNEILS